MNIREQIAIRLHTRERSLLRIIEETSPINYKWEDLTDIQREYYRKGADQILAIEDLHEEAENQDLPENPYPLDYDELPSEFQDEATPEDVYLMHYNGIEKGFRLMLKGDKDTHWVKVRRHL